MKKKLKVLLCVAGAMVVCAAALSLTSSDQPKRLTARMGSADALIEAYGEERLEAETRVLCSQCHNFPDPELYPSHRWPEEIDRALEFHERSGDKTLTVPDPRLVVAWFKNHAKDRLVLPSEEHGSQQTLFSVSTRIPSLKNRAGTSSLVITESKDILMSDMLSGRVRAIDANRVEYRTLNRMKNPARLRACDLSADFKTEYLVADLGTQGVTDDLCGSVKWLRKLPNGEFDAVTICEDVGRVADARSADFDGDGDQDVIVAEFGWDQTGSVVLLENDNGEFRRSVIDKRHGLVEIEVTDLNNDGRMDFVGIFGQEYETVELFENQGDLQFKPKRLFRADTPAFGISSLTIVDADADDDLDILVTSGDMYDGFHIQDHHGLYLMTNVEGEFEAEFISPQFAVMCAQGGDIDGDGDTDFVAASFIPQLSDYSRTNAYPAVVVHEQTEPGVWKQHVLKFGDCCHAAIELADLDDDGDLDVVVGNLHDVSGEQEPAFSIWTNQMHAAAKAASAATAGRSVRLSLKRPSLGK